MPKFTLTLTLIQEKIIMANKECGCDPNYHGLTRYSQSGDQKLYTKNRRYHQGRTIIKVHCTSLENDILSRCLSNLAQLIFIHRTQK